MGVVFTLAWCAFALCWIGFGLWMVSRGPAAADSRLAGLDVRAIECTGLVSNAPAISVGCTRAELAAAAAIDAAITPGVAAAALSSVH
jgi:hypothetical protein